MAFTSDSNARNVSIFRSRSESFEDVCLPYVSFREFSARVFAAVVVSETASPVVSPGPPRFADVGADVGAAPTASPRRSSRPAFKRASFTTFASAASARFSQSRASTLAFARFGSFAERFD